METEAEIIGIRTAVKKAMNHLLFLYKDKKIQDVLLEEVDFSSEDNQWLITIGFSLPRKKSASELLVNPVDVMRSRKYKIISIDAVSGMFLSMKIRNI